MSQHLFDLTDRVALVTGSGGGLGFTIARGLARAGATVVLNGRNPDKLAAAVSKLSEVGITAESESFDVTDVGAVAAGVAAIEKRVGPIDILVNNAGLQRRGPLAEIDKEAWDEVIAINLGGPFVCAQPVVKGMIARGRGKVINICSLMSEASRPTTGPYTASKGGLKMLTKAMAMEWAGHGIQVNGIGPGYFATEMTQKLRDDEQFNSWICGRTPAGRWGDPEELVGPAVFLASDASTFVSGQIIYVDGGILTCL